MKFIQHIVDCRMSTIKEVTHCILVVMKPSVLTCLQKISCDHMDVEVGMDVEEEKALQEASLKILELPDSIMEPNVLDTLRSFIYHKGTPANAIKALSGSYQGKDTLRRLTVRLCTNVQFGVAVAASFWFRPGVGLRLGGGLFKK